MNDLRLILVAAAITLTGCARSHAIGDYSLPPGLNSDGGATSPGSSSAAGAAPVLPDGSRDDRALDLLIVLDNSRSMAAANPFVIENLQDILEGLTHTLGEAEGLSSLQIGVVTTDLGAGGYPVPTCTAEERDDFGRLRPLGAGDAICDNHRSPYLRWTREQGNVAAAMHDSLACRLYQGENGCGYEQPLEAALLALTPSSSALRFLDSQTGLGDQANAGFLRDHATWAVLVFTTEDDCSVWDPAFFSREDYAGRTPAELRCSQHPEALYPIDRYVGGLLEMRGRSPERLVFGVIAGIPPSYDRSQQHGALDSILRDARLEERPHPTNPTRLAPSCTRTDRGEIVLQAMPPRRLLDVAQQLKSAGSQAFAASICALHERTLLPELQRRLRAAWGG